MVKWIGKFSLLLKRVRRRLDGHVAAVPPWAKTKYKTIVLPTWTKKMKIFKEEMLIFWIWEHRRPETGGMLHRWASHEQLFPFSDNLTTLMFIVASDLSEAQRETYQFPSSPGNEMSLLKALKQQGQYFWFYSVRRTARWRIFMSMHGGLDHSRAVS